MKNFLFIILTIFFFGCGKQKRIAPLINSRNAMNYVKQISQIAPRYSGHKGNAKCANLIAQIATANGAIVHIDKWNALTVNGQVNFQNVIAEIKGDSNEFIIVGSHFDTKKIDSVPLFSGANDGASSTGLLLEMIKSIANSRIKPYYSIRFIFFDGEECFIKYSNNDGLYGSRRYASFIKDNADCDLCKAVIICDMVGDKDLQITIPAGCSKNLTNKLFSAANAKGNGKYFSWHPNDIIDDHTPFKKIGLENIDVIDFDYGKYNRYWHTKADTVDKLSEKSLKIVGDVVLELIYNL